MNLDDLGQRIRWRLVLGLLGLALMLFILDSTGNMDSAFSFLRDPLSGMMGWTGARVDAFADIFAGPRDLQTARTEIEILQARIDMLERENEELRESQGELQVLQQLFNRNQDAPELSRTLANVIGRDTSPFFRSIIIDAGANEGIVVGMPVESNRGLVGQVYRTTANSAQVLLITDNLSSIPARLVDSRASGVTHGVGVDGTVVLDFISLEAEIQTAELVTSSGLGGRFPAGLIVGRVTQVQRGETGLFQSATIQPAVDFDRLEFVFVITDFDPIDTSVFDEPPEN
ncbi:MAG: rod shape-determining protein MreC [Anaerolineales bacterium]|nr:rod shape-determining protein MreC [Anaerolineales bacterium]